MSAKGKQRINATAHIDKDKVVIRYKELKDIIIHNSNIPFKDVIQKIAQISVGTFYNYIYPGNQMGQVSLYTVENLSDYFQLPKEIFTSEAPLTEEIKNQIISKISNDFYINNKSKFKNVTLETKESINSANSVLDSIKNISINLNNENDIEVLQQAITLLKTALTISNNRLNNLIEINKL